MSAPSLALVLAPFPGATPAARRGADARAAANDGDFAATLDAGATEPKPQPSTPTRPRAEASAPEPLSDAPAEANTDATAQTSADTPVPLAAPPPPVVPQALDESGQAEKGANPVSTSPTPAPGDLPLPGEIAAEDATSEAATASESAAAKAAATAASEAALAKASTAAAPPPVPLVAPRPSKPVPETAVATAPEEAEASAATTSQGSLSGADAVQTEVSRTRDVIDRAQAARPDIAQTATTGDAGAETGRAPDASSAGATKGGPVPSELADRPASTATTTDALSPAPLTTAPEATPATQAAETARIEARATEAATLALSTTSRASVETTAQIAAQIVRKLEARSTRFEMALTPDDLGRVDVSLDIDADGQLAARLAFDNPVAATELRGRVDELRRQLQEAGFTVADDALSFTQRDPSAGSGGAFDRGHDPRNARAFGAASRLSADADLAAAPARWIPLTLTPERVDLKV